MPRLKQRLGEAGLREYLLAAAVEFRDMYVDKALDLEPALSLPVNRLTRGEEHAFRRYELPGDHPARFAGSPGDLVLLTEEDVLRG